MKLNKKGVTLMEMLIVVIVIILLIAMAYPAYTSAIEKARAQEAIQLVSHIVAAQDRFRGECYSMDGAGNCLYSSDFTRLPLEIMGANLNANIAVTAALITTRNFTYTMEGADENTAITAVPLNTSYTYTISAVVGETRILCTLGANADRDRKICSAIGVATADPNTYVIV